MLKPVTIGIIGCGNISQAYFNGTKMFPILKIKGCADINMDAARAKAEENKDTGVVAMTVEELLADKEIELVINLTIPAVHAKVSMQILNAGKHVHLEKPLAVDLAEAKPMLALAKEKGLRVGCAPDTFLGAGLQTCRKILDDGWIGKPLSGTAMFLGHGPEGWHPNPAFFYQRGGGPMLDLGPYYITALVHLLGPARSVTAVTSKGFPTRLATCKEHFGEELPVEVSTHNAGIIEFENGALITVVISFDVWAHKHTNIELYGTEGSLRVPDPNGFGGPVEIKRADNPEWQPNTLCNPYHENSRSIGAADMAYGIRTGRAHRCSGELACHVLEIMEAFDRSSQAGARVVLETTCAQPAALPLGLPKGMLDK